MSIRLRSLALITLLFACSYPPTTYGKEFECRYIPELFKFYLKSHYSLPNLDDKTKSRAIEQYIKSLDPSKTFFLDGEVAKIKADLNQLYTTMPSGDCGALDRVQALLVSRTKENEEFLRKFLGNDYKVDENTEIVINPDKRGYAKTAEERLELLKKFVHFEVFNLLSTDMKLADAKKQLVSRYERATRRVSATKPVELMTDFMESFAQGLDPHSSFFSKDELEEFQIDMQLSLEGIGASLTSQDGYTVIEELMPGGAADRIKVLRPKDKITAVAQGDAKPVSVIDMDLKDVVKLIRGKKGTTVKLTILRQTEKTETFEVAIVRDKIDIKERAAKLSYETREVGGKKLKIGILELPSFYGGQGKDERSSYRDVKELVEKAAKEKVDGLVLDLSRNTGGLLDDAVKISGLFVKKGGVVATQDTQRAIEVLADQDDSVAYSGPLVIHTSRTSASASEILAGSLKDYKRAVVVGNDHTFGKGSVQVVSRLPLDLGAMKVTMGMYFLPGGQSTQHVGVNSDIVLPFLINTDEYAEKALDYSLPPNSIKPFLSADVNSTKPGEAWKPVDEKLLAKLRDASKLRVSKNQKFIELQKEYEEGQKNKGIVRLADIRKKNADDKKNGKNKKDDGKTAAQRWKEIEAPFLQESVNVVVDLIQAQQS